MICRRCVLTDRVPHVRIEKGLCQYCRTAPAPAQPSRERAEALGRFRAALKARRPAPYDAVLALSGGKDSGYALWLLRRRFGLRVLAFTVDNGFLAPEALENARVLTARLGADWSLFRPEPAPFRRALRASLDDGFHPAKSLERASAACLSCIGVVKYSALREAVVRGVPFVAFGWTPGQSPPSRAFLPLEPSLVRAMEAPLRASMERAAGSEAANWFLPEAAAGERFPAFVHPAAFYPYSERPLLARIRALGWRPPRGLDANSTNCRLNTLNVADHMARHGFHPYAHELASLVRGGTLSRSEALRRLRPVPASAAARLRRELGEK